MVTVSGSILKSYFPLTLSLPEKIVQKVTSHLELLLRVVTQVNKFSDSNVVVAG